MTGAQAQVSGKGPGNPMPPPGVPASHHMHMLSCPGVPTSSHAPCLPNVASDQGSTSQDSFGESGGRSLLPRTPSARVWSLQTSRTSPLNVASLPTWLACFPSPSPNTAGLPWTSVSPSVQTSGLHSTRFSSPGILTLPSSHSLQG
jgi:hypothetical protein